MRTSISVFFLLTLFRLMIAVDTYESMTVDRNLDGYVAPGETVSNSKPAGADALQFQGNSVAECNQECQKIVACLYITWNTVTGKCEIFNFKARIVAVDNWQYTTSSSFNVTVFSDGRPLFNWKWISYDVRLPMGSDSLFFMNGKPVAREAKGGGINVAVIDRLTRQLIHWERFPNNTYSDDMIQLAQILPDDVVLLASVYNGYLKCELQDHCQKFFEIFGGNQGGQINEWGNYAFIGYKGTTCKPNWIQENTSVRRWTWRNTIIKATATIPANC